MIVRTTILGLLILCGLITVPAQAATVNFLPRHPILERSFADTRAKAAVKRTRSLVSGNAFRAMKSKRVASVASLSTQSQATTRLNARLSFWDRNVPRPPRPPRDPNGGGGGSPGTPNKPPVVTEPPTATSVSYYWSFQCSSIFGSYQGACSGGGTLITDAAIGPASVISLTGTILGESILGLYVPDGWWRNDNLLVSLTRGLLNEGVSGYTQNWYFNLYLSLTPGAGDSILFCDARTPELEALCNRKDVAGQNDYWSGYARGSFSVLAVPPDVNPVPVPAALPLLLSALGLLGFIGWRKRRTASSVA